jgi:hypothetical protein
MLLQAKMTMLRTICFYMHEPGKALMDLLGVCDY